jgi:hypothetical protein
MRLISALGLVSRSVGGSLKINQSAASVFDHFGNGPDRLGFCCLMIGVYLALLISKDAITFYDVEMEPGHLMKRRAARPVPRGASKPRSRRRLVAKILV